MRRRVPAAVADHAPIIGIAVAVAAICGVVAWHVASPPPLSWLDRGRLPECPAVVVAQGEMPPTSSSCLFGDAASDAGAELVVTQPTSEGDPVRTYYRRLRGHPGLEVVIDASDDAFGGFAWERQTCPQATALDDLGPCTSLP